MRTDIEINAKTNDMVIRPTSKLDLYSFKWLDGVPEGQLQSYIYGEVEVSSLAQEKKVLQGGIAISIGYTPVYKPIKIRIKRLYEDGASKYLYNPTDNSIWFTLYSALYGAEIATEIKASELQLIDKDCYFLKFGAAIIEPASTHLKHYSNVFQVFSAHTMDFNIQRADNQNTNMLLLCVPANNYRYPLSGVGLIRWINSNANDSTLAERISEEFSEDGVTIRNASFNSDTMVLTVDANYDDVN